MPKRLFLIAALYNFAVGLTALWAFFFHPSLDFFNFNDYIASNPLAVTFIVVLAGIVLLFGLSFWLLFQNFVAYRPMLILGILGKLAIVGMMPILFFLGFASALTFCLSLGDLVFSILFWRVWKQTA